MLCIRFYDEAVREMGSALVVVPTSGTVQDVLAQAQESLNADWGITGPWRVLEVVESRISKICKPDLPVGSLACSTKNNFFYHSLRVETDDTPEGAEPMDGGKLIEIYHLDRHSHQAFAQPFLMRVAQGETSGSIKARCKAKLRVPDTEFKSWRLVRSSRSGKTHLKDHEPWDADSSADAKLCLEHVHPADSLARQSRYNKPLTIKA